MIPLPGLSDFESYLVWFIAFFLFLPFIRNLVDLFQGGRGGDDL